MTLKDKINNTAMFFKRVNVVLTYFYLIIGQPNLPPETSFDKFAFFINFVGGYKSYNNNVITEKQGTEGVFQFRMHPAW